MIPRARQREVRRTQRSILWFRQNKQWVRTSLYGLAVLAAFSVVFQLFYPDGRLLPFVQVQGHHLGGRTTTDVVRQLEQSYPHTKVSLKTHNKTFTNTLSESGITLKSGPTTDTAAHYPFWQRIIPFSSLAIMVWRDTPGQVGFDDERLKAFATQVSEGGYIAPVNATVVVKGSKAEVVPAKLGKEYPVTAVTAALRDADYGLLTELTLAAKPVPPQRTDNDVEGVRETAQQVVGKPVTLNLDKEKVPVSKKTIGSWLDFVDGDHPKHVKIVINAKTAEKYLESIQKKIYKAPGTTRIHLIDDREVNRAVGTRGYGIHMDKAVAALGDVISRSGQLQITVPTGQLAPAVTYDKQYSNTDSKLTSLVASVAASKGGYGISVMEIGGRSSNANGNKKFEAASTYKLFVAYAVVQWVNAGQMKWSDTISNGQSAATCFEIMITKSDNPCAVTFGARIGWQKIENMMRDLGLTATDLTGSILTTTANDLAFFLYKLQNGTLLPKADSDRLIGYMKQQVYRAGIPKGTGLTVANKVGFLDYVFHDAAIVYRTKGPYVLVIMTSSNSWAGIADAAQQINVFLNK